MTTLHLYQLDLNSADTTQGTYDFIRDQRAINRNVKYYNQKLLKEKNLSNEFAFAAARGSRIARMYQVYASPAVAEGLKEIKNIKNVTQMTTSAYALTREI